MTPYKDLSREELLKEKENLEQQFAEIKAKGLKLDMSRGKPSVNGNDGCTGQQCRSGM